MSRDFPQICFSRNVSVTRTVTPSRLSGAQINTPDSHCEMKPDISVSPPAKPPPCTMMGAVPSPWAE